MQCKLLSTCTGRVHRWSTLALLPWNIKFLTFVLEKNAEKTDIQNLLQQENCPLGYFFPRSYYSAHENLTIPTYKLYIINFYIPRRMLINMTWPQISFLHYFVRNEGCTQCIKLWFLPGLEEVINDFTINLEFNCHFFILFYFYFKCLT